MSQIYNTIVVDVYDSNQHSTRGVRVHNDIARYRVQLIRKSNPAIQLSLSISIMLSPDRPWKGRQHGLFSQEGRSKRSRLVSVADWSWGCDGIMRAIAWFRWYLVPSCKNEIQGLHSSCVCSRFCTFYESMTPCAPTYFDSNTYIVD